MCDRDEARCRATHVRPLDEEGAMMRRLNTARTHSVPLRRVRKLVEVMAVMPASSQPSAPKRSYDAGSAAAFIENLNVRYSHWSIAPLCPPCACRAHACVSGI